MPNTRISDLTAATSVAGTDVYPSVQTAGVGPVKTSLTQITAFALANAPAGAVATPSIAPTGDTNTGFWFPAADTIAVSTGGSERMRINSSGNVGIGTASPSDRFVVENASANVKSRISAGGSASYTASLALGTTARDWEVTAGNSSSNYLFSLNYTGTDAPLSNIFVVSKGGNVGIGTTSPGANLEVSNGGSIIGIFNGIGTDARIEYKIGGTRYAYSYWDTTEFRSFAASGVASTFYAGGTERMRITSAGNVGIGTTAPATTLTVGNLPVAEAGSPLFGSVLIRGSNYTPSATQRGILDIAFDQSTSAQDSGSTLSFSNNYSHFGQGFNYVGAALKAAKETSVNAVQSTYLSFYTNLTGTLSERMRITSAGNVGIGTTSAWSGLRGLQNGNASLSAASFDGYLSANVFFDGSGWKYINSAFGIQYFQDATTDGAHVWRTAASGSAGAAATLTERMRITSAGNVLIGTTSSPTTGTQCLTIETETAPTATPADTVTFYSSDLSAGNTMPSFYTEGTIVGTGTPTADRTIAVRINGTVYYLLASTIP